MSERRAGARGSDTVLVHSRLPDRPTLLNVSSGWHAHLDVMADKLAGHEPTPFWDRWLVLEGEYDRRLPA